MDYDGRYEGSGDSYSVALRIDVGGSGVISADIFRGTDYLTSVRTRWGLRCDSAIGRWAAEFSASVATTGSGLVAGTMTIAPNGEPSAGLIVTVRPDMDLPGLPAGQDAVVTVEWRGAEVRELGLEVETEEDVVAPGPTAFAGTDINERECLRRAGFAVRAVGAPGRIPRQAEPWDFSRMFTLLHDTMTARAQSDLSAAAWQLHLLLLSDSTLEGLQGIMFDGAGVLPRQGAAVFLDEIRAYAAAHHHNPDRNAIRTVVHELGHALNLAHRWEPQVGHLESTSFMNYPWKFVPGGTDAYWTEFKFTFDADELEFLRHGPLGAVRPGDAPFHSVAYWSGNGWLPPAPEPLSAVLRLALKPPPAGTTFMVGQPVYLEVVLENNGDSPVPFKTAPLDLKTEALKLFVRPRPFPDNFEGFQQFVPMVKGCVQPAEEVTLGAHDSLSNNLNIGYGANGNTFPEAGDYQVLALLAEPPWRARSGILQITITPAADKAGERETDTLLRPDVGAWFALGGTDALESAGAALEELRVQRQVRLGDADPIVAAIVRAAGINAGRAVTRFQNGQFRGRAGDPVLAETLLGGLDAAALRTFDNHTAAGTVRLAEHYAARNRGE